MFMIGWIAAHQWMLYQEPTVTLLTSHLYQFKDTVQEKPTTQEFKENKEYEVNRESKTLVALPTVGDHVFTTPVSSPKPSWHRLLDCSINAISECFVASNEYETYPTFDTLPPVRTSG
jgi:hypothetical protein